MRTARHDHMKSSAVLEQEGGREVGRRVLHTVGEINAWSDMVICSAADQRGIKKN